MRILVDSCVAKSVVVILRESGYEVDWVQEWDHDPGDRAILQHAFSTQRVLLTRDKDFGRLIFRDGAPHNGVIRLVGEMGYSEQASRVLAALVEFQPAIESHAIITIEPERVRVSNSSQIQ